VSHSPVQLPHFLISASVAGPIVSAPKTRFSLASFRSVSPPHNCKDKVIALSLDVCHQEESLAVREFGDTQELGQIGYGLTIRRL